MQQQLKLEACVGNFSQALKAYQKKVYRIELCENLAEGGTTPSHGTIWYTKQMCPDLKIAVMIRPRGGNFVYDKDEIEIMKFDINICKQLQVDSVVFAVLNQYNTLNLEVLQELVNLSKPMQTVFHMAFDELENQFEALEQIIKLGFDRILTRGASKTAIEGKDRIKELVEKANGRITIMPGAGVNQENFESLAEYTGAKELHGTKIVGSLSQNSTFYLQSFHFSQVYLLITF